MKTPADVFLVLLLECTDLINTVTILRLTIQQLTHPVCPIALFGHPSKLS